MARKPGKYAAVIGNLPKLPTVEPERRDIVDKVKAEILAPPSDDDPEIDSTIHEIVDDIDDDIRDIIQAAKRATAGRHHAAEFARVYAELRMAISKIDDWRSNVNLLLDAYIDLMVEQYEVEGISSLKLADGTPVATYPEPYAQVVDKEAFRQWCMSDPDLVRKMMLPWQTTNLLTKDRLLAGEPEPDGVTIFAKTKIRLG